jgi:tripartite-type tricarboxylate transporter receptor subunit TctC
MRRRPSLVLCPVAAALIAAAVPAQAQDYPAKPVTFISPAAAGNSPDVATRLIADRLGAMWKQNIVIINRPGAGGMIAAQAASGAVPDGYTLYMTQASTYTVLPMTLDPMPVDLDKAFVPIALIGEQPIAISVTPSLGVGNVVELIAKIRTTPGGMLFAATNRGGQSHLTGELFQRRAGVPMSFVSAAGAAASINDVAAGRIPIMFEGIAGVAGAWHGGLIKTLAIGAAKRLPNYPDLPTIAETIPGFQSQGWIALMAPAGTPEAIVQKVNADLKSVLADDDIRDRFAKIGTYPHYLTPTDTAAYIKTEEQTWWPLVKEVGIKK